MYIIVKNRKNTDWQRRKDFLHRRRLFLSERIQEGIMSKSDMNKGEEGEPDFDKKVNNYCQWKTSFDNKIGMTKEKAMEEWGNINREFKKNGEEGRLHTIDDLRQEGKLKFD